MALKTPEDRYIRAGGLRTRYWDLGGGDQAVILLHGLGASAELWLHNLDALARDRRIVVPDLAGFGLSERPPDSFSPLDYTGYLDELLHALNIGEASLVGQSLGGAVALAYTLRFPHRVGKLVLADSAGLGHEVIWTLRLMSLPGIGEIVSYPTRLGVRLFFLLAVRNPQVLTADFIDFYCALFRRPGFRAFLLKIVRMLVGVRGAKRELLDPLMERLPEIRQPTLIVWGERDRVFPLRHAYFGLERIPNARLHVMQGCGHVPNLERPEEFNRVVRDFLAGC